MFVILFLITLCMSSINASYDPLVNPRISIITSVYDGDDFIAGFLSDITRQTIFEQCELIMINANSPGDEEPIIQAYMQNFPNIVYKKLDKDPGLYPVWNMAIKMAKAPFITNANLDDRRNPASLEMHVKVLEEKDYVDLVYSDFHVTFGENETYECNTHPYSVFPAEFSPGAMYRCITGPQPMWRKDVHDRCGYFDESYISGGDFEMWNRAVSKGSIFQKVSGISGLYYYNLKGLSTDIAKEDIQKEELARINDLYSYMWVTDYQYFCTAADAKYFSNLLNLIGSIHNVSYKEVGEIAVFDLGMTQEQIEHLRTIDKVTVRTIELTHADLLRQFMVSEYGKTVPGWYAWKFVILKQALELFPYALWVDSGTTILKPLNSLFRYIQDTGYFLCTMGDEKFYDQIVHPIKWGTTNYVKEHFHLDRPENKWILDKEPLLSGTLGVSRKALDYLVMPLYDFSSHLRLFEDDGTTENGFGTARHDQTILSIFAYKNGLTIHSEDHTQGMPIYLPINGKYEDFYVTWDKEFVNDNTCIYNSRCDLSNYDYHVNCIRYK